MIKVKYLFKNKSNGKQTKKREIAFDWFKCGDIVEILRNGKLVAVWN